MVGLVCHSSFKAIALEVIFAYESFGWLTLGISQVPASPSSSDTEFGRRVLALAGSSAHGMGRVLYTPGILISTGGGVELQS